MNGMSNDSIGQETRNHSIYAITLTFNISNCVFQLNVTVVVYTVRPPAFAPLFFFFSFFCCCFRYFSSFLCCALSSPTVGAPPACLCSGSSGSGGSISMPAGTLVVNTCSVGIAGVCVVLFASLPVVGSAVATSSVVGSAVAITVTFLTHWRWTPKNKACSQWVLEYTMNTRWDMFRAIGHIILDNCLNHELRCSQGVRVWRYIQSTGYYWPEVAIHWRRSKKKPLYVRRKSSDYFFCLIRLLLTLQASRIWLDTYSIYL